MAQRTHNPQSGRRRKKKRSQNNFLESHVWSQISGKPVERQIFFFFLNLQIPYFEVLKNGRHGSNCLGVKNHS